MNWSEPKAPLTPAELETEQLITEAYKMPVGWSMFLPPRSNDGLGGMVVTRHSERTLIFQRAGYQGRSRWADNANEAREEVTQYLETGTLREPDNIKGW